MLNISVEKAKEELAALVRRVVSKGETIVLQTADGVQAALVSLAILPQQVTQVAFTYEQEMTALAAADRIREKVLARRGGQPFDGISQDLEALRELRLLELQGVY